MKKSGPIIVIEDDEEDQMLLDEIFRNLKFDNRVIFFSDGDDALQYLNATEEHPLLILSDINMPKMDGFEVRDKVSKNERLRSIPYLFFTTGVNKEAIDAAYAMCVQGFFIKPARMSDMQDTIRKIVEYWQECCAPGPFN